MANPHYEHYWQTEILSADPVKLVNLLYRGAIDAIGAARLHLLHGDIRERSRQITRASEIINELMRSLNHPQGGEISRTLGGLYAYMQNRLIEANSRQVEAPLVEVQRLLGTLLEAWSAIPAPAPIPMEMAESIRDSASW